MEGDLPGPWLPNYEAFATLGLDKPQVLSSSLEIVKKLFWSWACDAVSIEQNLPKPLPALFQFCRELWKAMELAESKITGLPVD